MRAALSKSQPFYADWSLAPAWVFLAAIALAGAWLQPNHYHPWAAFHADTWVACAGLVAAAVAFATSRDGRLIARWHASALFCGAAVGILVCQFAFGQVRSAGFLFVNVAYWLGLLLALFSGVAAEGSRQRQRLLDTLFLAIGIAGFVSVLIQLHQWLRLPVPFFWVMEGGEDRPYANLGQANQLATLLVWSLIAVGWGVARGAIGLRVAALALLYLVLGLALTRSRAGIAEVAAVVVCVWVWRRLWPHRYVFPAVAGFVALYVALLIAVPAVTVKLFPDIALSGASASVLDSASTNIRLTVYRMYLEALWLRPWAGYGWNQLALGQLEVAEYFPPMYALFVHAHNLFLDFAVGVGLPLTLLAAAVLGWWLIRSLCAVNHADDALLLLLVITVGVHSMLELPLHYGYFLWPTGFVIGILNVRLGHRSWSWGGAPLLAGLWLACALALGLIVRDYLLAEEEYRITRFEALRVGRTPDGPRPEMWVLTQMTDLMWIARAQATAGMSPQDLDRLERVASMYPSLPGLLKLAEALTLNQRPDEAAKWLRRLQRVVPLAQVEAGAQYWRARTEEVPALSAAPWPR